jgi:glycine cleavage system H protein
MSEIKFHKEHTWVRLEDDDIGTVGISDYAQEQLGKIIYVELPEEGTEVTQGEEFGQIESSKSMSDLISPVSGEVIETNEALEDDPSIINDSPYDEGWMIKVKLSNPDELDELLDRTAYEAMVSEEEE